MNPMGEIINFPNTDKPIFVLDPTRDESWDTIIDEAYMTGSCLYEYEGKMFELKIEDLSPPDAA
jgi:hypothetical protein